ncbi:PSD1 and planctomycete cytochrome C domain-containing protein [Blastopirellula sp. J2-11]|uniref:PSD1 and planctomycete cytochrome C domain-containing protein n=1 Tax=Blastopirellula sp. J2-11 TaxID=2943192 RepID=UPI0021C8BE88|nr:PSD1 and planctomycete cytochrome C domain-containing protein [Blastopirellula sp. J2-11]UUO07197.1 PSD1 and planctomycete cytochrome C domain-containing protein [Blastopirellula sp. J2-11]
MKLLNSPPRILLSCLMGLFGVTLASVESLADPFPVVSDRFVPSTEFSVEIPGTQLIDGWQGGWKLSNFSPAAYDPAPPTDWPPVVIHGTGQRNNPLRRQLSRVYSEDELFVGFRFVYQPNPLAAEPDPEFFVLWLDRTEGSDHAVHNAAIPNIGIHQADRGASKGRNVFMLRFGSGQTAWSQHELEPGKTYRLIARLSKEVPGERNDYSQMELWINPEPESRELPNLKINRQAGIHQIHWVGFATGAKTEVEDQIRVGDLVLSSSWDEAYEFLYAARPAASEKQGKPKFAWKETVDFKRDIYPLLLENCFECHAGEFPDSGYRLDVRSELLGHSTGHALAIPGDSRNNPLLHVLTSNSDSERMPPDGDPLSEKQIALIRAWIEQGLDWDDKLLPEPRIESEHWAFQRVERPEVPQMDGTAHPNPIDAFLAARQHALGLTPSEKADRRTQIRRLYLNAIGLPPTEEETEEFLQDQSPEAYARLVDNVLASPHAGERTARMWLDLVRWGESEGHQHDIPRPFAWRYRDYVINSFNSDKPYDQFLQEQLAGDELQPTTDEAVIATGFLAAARISGNQMDKDLQRTDVLFDIVDNTASALLGLTMECAQCHNHKFEPITQRDYYRFYAFFSRGQMGNIRLLNTENPAAQEIQQWFTKNSYKFYLSEAKKLKIDPAEYPAHTWGYYSPVTGSQELEYLPVVNRSPLPYSPEFLKRVETHILIRGDVRSPGLRVEPGWPAVLGTIPSELTPTPRQALAQWLGSRDNPLVARIWVNRIWQMYFGRGIVATSSDFGTHGSLPSHPELLDWLAVELMENSWSTRHIQRLILTSSVYRQSATFNAENYAIDPENVQLWRWPQHRLQAEAIRDSLLVVTGELNRQVGGPSVAPHQDEQQLRRTIYLSQRRSELPDVMRMFDGPEALRSCSRRETSTVALQPLYLLNNPFVVKRATLLASQIRDKARDDHRLQIKLAFSRILGRSPTESEIKRSLAMLESHEADEESERRTLTQLLHSLMNLNEFVYLP